MRVLPLLALVAACASAPAEPQSAPARPGSPVGASVQAFGAT